MEFIYISLLISPLLYPFNLYLKGRYGWVLSSLCEFLYSTSTNWFGGFLPPNRFSRFSVQFYEDFLGYKGYLLPFPYYFRICILNNRYNFHIIEAIFDKSGMSLSSSQFASYLTIQICKQCKGIICGRWSVIIFFQICFISFHPNW